MISSNFRSKDDLSDLLVFHVYDFDKLKYKESSN
jgi:hypothetical protein